MLIASHDTDASVLIIAEIGNNHEGDFELAKDMLLAAIETGVHAVKFQTIVAERLVSKADAPDRLNHFARFCFSYNQFAELAELATKAGTIFLSTPFDIESARFLDAIVPAFKIASGDNTFYPLLAAVAATEKPIILSTGLCNGDDVSESVQFLRKQWRISDDAPLTNRLALLHCVAAYPTPASQANLATISSLVTLGATPGYSDHTLGIEAAILSVACGARIIEKHFTLDKQYSNFRDHQLSADPSDMKELVRRVQEAETLLGSPVIHCGEAEGAGKQAFRRSIVAAHDITAGTTLDWDDLAWVRPGGGMAPGQEKELLGRRLTRGLRQGERFTFNDLD